MIIIQENNNNITSVTDILKRSVVAVGFFVGCAYSGQGIPALNQTLNTQPLIQRDGASYVSSRKKDDERLMHLNHQLPAAVTINIPMLKDSPAGYTILKYGFSDELEAKVMGIKDNDKNIRKPISKSTQQKNWTEYVKETFKGSREFTKEESKMHSELLNDLSVIVERLY